VIFFQTGEKKLGFVCKNFLPGQILLWKKSFFSIQWQKFANSSSGQVEFLQFLAETVEWSWNVTFSVIGESYHK